LRIEAVQFDDPVVVLVGTEWSVSIVCPWRLMRGEAVVTSIDDPNAGASLNELVGIEIVDVISGASAEVSNDPVFILGDGTRLEILADTDLDPWTVRLSDQTFVGSRPAE
jgi:hypothetical protein